MVLLTASGSMDNIEVVESPKPELSLKRKRLGSENRRRRVKKDDADNVDFVLETDATVGLFELKQTPDDYITNIVNPLLRQGDHANLFRWLYHMQLLKHLGSCSVPGCVSKPMKLKKCPRLRDKVGWEALSGECTHRCSMRTGSFFETLKCDFSQALTVIREWCSNTPISDTRLKYVDINEVFVKRIYQQCLDVADTFVGMYTCHWMLGGEGSVVLIDLWPMGIPSIPAIQPSPTRRRGEKVRVLWLADTNYLPVRYWAQVLPPLPPSKGLKGEARKEDALQRHETFVRTVVALAQKHIAPGSLVLVNDKSLPDVCSALAETKSYEAVTSLDNVLEADCDGHQSTKSILDNIWNEASRFCYSLHPMSRASASRHLSEFLWRQQFGSSDSAAFYEMLKHIAKLYKPPPPTEVQVKCESEPCDVDL